MRRLPIFFVIDVSESMVGENILQVSKGMDAMVRTLRADPYALESVYLSIIVFAGKASVLTQLVELTRFSMPRLPVGSGTSLGAALSAVMAQIDECVVKGNATSKGDWKPIVYLFTDGKPTDNASPPIERWKREYARKASLVAVGIGPYASLSVLASMTENAFHLKNERQEDFFVFVKWLSQSISSQSQSVVDVERGSRINLAKFDDTVLQKVGDVTRSSELDEDFVILTGKCESKKLPYVIRYRRLPPSNVLKKLIRGESNTYEIEGGFALENDYFSLSDDRPNVQTISSEALGGQTSCPHCGTSTGVAVCSCSGIHCLKKNEATCPWCNTKAVYEFSGSGFDVNRARG
jgi:uncharacterized protein YegL